MSELEDYQRQYRQSSEFASALEAARCVASYEAEGRRCTQATYAHLLQIFDAADALRRKLGLPVVGSDLVRSRLQRIKPLDEATARGGD